MSGDDGRTLSRFLRKINHILVKKIRAVKSYVWVPILSTVYTLLAYRGDWLTIGGDSLVPFHPTEYLMQLASNSNPWAGFGSNLPAIFSFPPLPDILLFSAFRILNFNIYMANKLYVFVLSTLVIFSIHYLASTVFHENAHKHVIGVVAACAYIYNPLVFADTYKTMVFMELSLVQTGFILFFAFSIKYFQTTKTRYTLYAGLISFLMLSYPGISAYRLAFLAFAGYVFVAVYYLAQHFGTELSKAICRILKSAAILVIVSFLVNSYWIIPFMQNASSFSSFAASFQTKDIFNKFSTMVNTLRLMNSWSLYSGYVPYSDIFLTNPIVIALTFVWPFFAFLPLISKKMMANRKILTIYTATVLTILLSWGSAYSFGPSYMAIVNTHIGSYYLLRPFYNPAAINLLVLTVEYALLIGLCSSLFYSKLIRESKSFPHTKRKIAAVLGVVLVATLLASSSWPLLTGDIMRNWYKPDEYGVRIPDSYWEADEYLGKLSDQSRRTLLLPPTETYVGTLWGFQGTSQFYNLMFNVPLVTGNEVPYSVTSNKTLLSQVYSIYYTIPNENAASGIIKQANRIITWQNDKAMINDESLQIDFNSTYQTDKFHQVQLKLPFAVTWSNFTHMMIQFTAELNLGQLQIGVGDTKGYVGWWYASKQTYQLDNVTLIPTETKSVVTKDSEPVILLVSLENPDRSTYSILDVSSVWIQYFVTNSSDTASLLIDKMQAVKAQPDTLYYAKLLANVNIRYLMVDLAIKDGAKDNPQLWLDMLTNSKYFKVIWQENTLYIVENVISE